MKLDVGHKRLTWAVAIVVALVAAAPITGIAFGSLSGSHVQAIADGGIRAADIVEEGDAGKTLSRIEELAEASRAQLPAYFEEEIGLLDGARDVRADETGRVVGFLVDKSSRDAFDCVRENMVRAGWSEVSLGGAEGSTFVKEGGSCAWALVTCTQVGQVTAVVYRCVVR